MIACIQRVSRARVTVGSDEMGAIGAGMLVLLGVGHGDDEREADRLADKLVGLRIFDDTEGRMNRSLIDVGGAMLVVSQFTLFGDCRHGRRPGFSDAAPPDEANRLYEYFVHHIRRSVLTVATGVFRTMMSVELVNDGPVTLWLDSRTLGKRH